MFDYKETMEDQSMPTYRQQYESYIDELRRATSRGVDVRIPTFPAWCELYGLTHDEALREWENPGVVADALRAERIDALKAGVEAMAGKLEVTFRVPCDYNPADDLRGAVNVAREAAK